MHIKRRLVVGGYISPVCTFQILSSCYWDGQIKNDEVAETCGTQGDGMHMKLWLENVMERDHLADLGLGGRII